MEKVVLILVADVEDARVVAVVVLTIVLEIVVKFVIEMAIAVVILVITVVEVGVFTIVLVVLAAVTVVPEIVMLMAVPARVVAVVVELVEIALEHVLAVVLVPPYRCELYNDKRSFTSIKGDLIMPTLYETKYMLRNYQKNVEALRVNDADVTYNFTKDIIEKYKSTVLANEARILSVVKRYIALNASKLGARAPINKIPFTDHDKSVLFIAAGIKEKEIQESINKLAGTNNIDLRNNVINNPFNVLCSILTSVFFMADPKRNDKKRDFTKPYYYTSLYLSIQFYGKIYISSFPKADPQASVMDYTIENISNKFLMKKVNNVFEIIKYFSESNIENMYNRLERHADIDLIYFSSNLYNRMHNSMKTLASEFYKNKKEKNYIGTETSNMTDDSGDFYVGNVTNISASIDSAVKKVVMKFVSDSVIDDTILNAACAKTKFSKAKMTLILHRMREQNDPLMQTIMAEIISYYLIAYKKPESAIKSSEFALSMIKLYGISNTKDNQVLNIKKHLGQLIQNNSKNILKEGNENMLERVKNALFVYFVLFIVKNIE